MAKGFKISRQELEKIAEQFEKQRGRHDKMMLDFADSARFKEIVNSIKFFVNMQGAIGDDPYADPLFGNVSNEEFLMVFTYLFDKSLSGIELSKDDIYEQGLIYEGMYLCEVHGQGTAFIVSRIQ